MKRTLWAWSFYHPSVKILRSRCDSRLAGTEQSTDCEEEEEGKEEKVCF